MEHITLSNTSSVILYATIILVAYIFMVNAERLENSKESSDLMGSPEILYRHITYRGLMSVKKSNVYLCLSIFALAMPAFFRYQVGIDYAAYWPYTELMANASSLKVALTYRSVEDSMAIISYYCGRLFGSSVYMYGLYAVATQVLFVLGIWNFRKKISPSLALVIYCCTFYFRTYNIFRQALALAIVFYSLKFIFEKKYLKFLVAVLIAGLFHQSAYISFLLLYYFSLKERKSGVRRWIEYVLPVVSILALESIMELVFTIPIFSKYANNYGVISTSISISSIISLGTLLKIVVCAVFFYCIVMKKKTDGLDSYDDIFIKFMLCDLIVYFFVYVVSYSSRFGLYFSIGSFASVASIYPSNSYTFDGGKIDIRICFIFAVALCYLYGIMSGNGYGQLPYSFWY